MGGPSVLAAVRARVDTRRKPTPSSRAPASRATSGRSQPTSERGVALNFEWIDDAERLDALVKSLPPIFCITEEDDSTQRVVLTELVPNLLRRKRP